MDQRMSIVSENELKDYKNPRLFLICQRRINDQLYTFEYFVNLSYLILMQDNNSNFTDSDDFLDFATNNYCATRNYYVRQIYTMESDHASKIRIGCSSDCNVTHSK
jgi:hypothetical protein